MGKICSFFRPHSFRREILPIFGSTEKKEGESKHRSVVGMSHIVTLESSGSVGNENQSFVGVGRRLNGDVSMEEVTQSVPSEKDLIREAMDANRSADMAEIVVNLTNTATKTELEQDILKERSVKRSALVHSVKRSDMVQRMRIQSKLLDKEKEELREQAVIAKSLNKRRNLDIDCMLLMKTQSIDLKKKAIRQKRLWL